NKKFRMANILLVEDDTTFSAIIENYLKKHHYKVDPYFSIAGSIDALAKHRYDLILLDYRLGDGDGFEVLDYVFEKGLQIPVIVMTGVSDVRTAVKAMRKGVYDYITKPVNPEELLMILKAALESEPASPSVSLVEKASKESQKVLPDYIRGKSRLA